MLGICIERISFGPPGIVGCGTQPLGGAFGCDVTLRRSEHFVAEHKFANGCGTQQRWKKMRVKMPFVVRCAVRRLLMKSHGIGKWRLKEIVKDRSRLLEDRGERAAFVVCHIGHRGEMALRQDHCLEW